MTRVRGMVWLGVCTAVLPAAPLAHDRDAFVLAGPCLSCHGRGPAAVTDIPSLDGLSAAAMAEALDGFRSGRRAGTIMPRLVRGYDATQIARLTAWLAAEQVRP